jgi:hypothetical protein
MESNQIARMIEWLDEERRRDKSTIATLEERLVQQQEVIETLTRRLSGRRTCQQAATTKSSPRCVPKCSKWPK